MLPEAFWVWAFLPQPSLGIHSMCTRLPCEFLPRERAESMKYLVAPDIEYHWNQKPMKNKGFHLQNQLYSTCLVYMEASKMHKVSWRLHPFDWNLLGTWGVWLPKLPKQLQPDVIGQELPELRLSLHHALPSIHRGGAKDSFEVFLLVGFPTQKDTRA